MGISNNSKNTIFDPIESAIEDMKQGKMVVLVDDEDRENEGDLCIAAEAVTPEHINFMAKHGRGLICLAMDGALIDQLNLPQMTNNNTATFGTPFTVSIDAAEGITTGISAQDRSVTIKKAVTDGVQPEDMVVPGHIFPLRARDGGVLVRIGQTEGSVDLARLAGRKAAGVICEILNEDGTMSRRDDLRSFCDKHGFKLVTIADLVDFRRKNECHVEKKAETTIKTRFGTFRAVVYQNIHNGDEHLAYVKGDINSDNSVLVRVHSKCLTGDTLGSLKCDCGQQLQEALKQIGQNGGLLLYMDQEGRGIGLANKIRAYEAQKTKGLDTVEANHWLGLATDLRDYGIGAQILYDLGVRKMRLLTNNPKKVVGLDGYGLEIVETVPIEIEPGDDNRKYLETKRTKLGHVLTAVND